MSDQDTLPERSRREAELLAEDCAEVGGGAKAKLERQPLELVIGFRQAFACALEPDPKQMAADGLADVPLEVRVEPRPAQSRVLGNVIDVDPLAVVFAHVSEGFIGRRVSAG